MQQAVTMGRPLIVTAYCYWIGNKRLGNKKSALRNLARRLFTDMVRLMGLEPIRAYAHHPLKMACLPFHHNRMELLLNGASGQNRTVDTRIFSPLLYRLSYRGKYFFEAKKMATPIRFELTIFAVTGRHVNRYTTGPQYRCFRYSIIISWFYFLRKR